MKHGGPELSIEVGLEDPRRAAALSDIVPGSDGEGARAAMGRGGAGRRKGGK